jgi:hypothetical protein
LFLAYSQIWRHLKYKPQAHFDILGNYGDSGFLNLNFVSYLGKLFFPNKEFVIQNHFGKVTKNGQMFFIYVTLNVGFAKIHITTCREIRRGLKKRV